MSASTSNTKGSVFAPLRIAAFQRIWATSILSNFGQLILGVGVAWEMTRLTDSSTMVALVQTALALPLMFISLPAGAIADMYDRRKVAMSGLGIAVFFAAILTLLAFYQLTTPWVLLFFCALISIGVGFYYPAWSSSIGEQVPTNALPAAIALNSISYNVARSFGPAVGGFIVVAAGAQAAFGVTALAYLPLILAFYLWKRGQVPSRLPPERITRAIISGVRYALHSSPIRIVLIRIFIFTFASATSTAGALAPLITKNMLHGDAGTFGILLGATGVGAVFGALMVSKLNDKFTTEQAVSGVSVMGGIVLIGMGFSHWLILTCLLMFVAGASTMIAISLMNIVVQLSAPRWVIARSLSLFTSFLTGGIAFGSWCWGTIADHWSIEVALIAAGIYVMTLPVFALMLPLPNPSSAGAEAVDLTNEPEVELPITMRSGPIVIDIEYRIDPDNAREYYDAMQQVRRVRLRNGGFNWSISRDIGDPAQWTERFHFPAWGDYLRMRDRSTQSDIDAQLNADQYLMPGSEKRIRRGLERPFGSVRWKVSTPDTPQDSSVYIGS